MEKIDTKTRLRQANGNYILKAENDIENSEENPRTPFELYRRKINDNLKILNMKTTNVIQDGLNGVESICNQVRECLKDEQRCMICSEKYMDNCGSGDIKDYVEENIFSSTDTYRTQDAPISLTSNPPAVNSKEIPINNKIFTVRNIEEDTLENLLPSKRRDTSESHPIFTDSGVKKTTPTCKQQELASTLFNDIPNTSETAKKCVKRKNPTTKTKKKRSDTDSEVPPNTNNGKPEKGRDAVMAMGICAKERLGKIEKDYEKVVKSLEMVEQMMASISRKVSDSEKLSQRSSKTEDEEKLHTPKSSTAEENLLKQEKTEFPQTLERQTKAKMEDKPDKKKKIVDKDWVNEMIKRKKAREIEGKDCAENITQRIEEVQMEEVKNIDPELKPRSSEDFAILSHPSTIKLRESLSDLDALIDNAVQELGNLVSDFDISQNSSDVSFRLTTVDDAKNLYEEYLQDSSSSNFSESAFGEDSPKFDISKSFQELKESFLRESRQKVAKSTRKQKPKLEMEKCEGFRWNDKELLTEDKREKTNDDNSEQINFIHSLTSQISSNEFISDVIENREQEDEEKTNVHEKEGNHEVTEAMIDFSMRQNEVEEDNEDIIAIPMPYDEQLKSCSKSTKASPTIDYINPEQVSEDTILIRTTLNEDSEDRKKDKTSDDFEQEQNDKKEKVEDDVFSESEFCECVEEFESHGEEEIVLSTEKIEKDQKKTPIDVDGESSAISSENTPVNSATTRYKLAESEMETEKPPRSDHGLTSSGSSSSTQSLNKDNQPTAETQGKPLDPMKQISVQCKKMIGDLVVEQNEFSLGKLMKGFFNSALIHTAMSRFKRGRCARLYSLVQDPDLKDIEPNVHRKKAVSDLHDRMEHQIRQTDSFHGFLNLMNKNRRKAMIKHAERQDHNYRCQIKSCFRKRYPFKVVTASVPPNYDMKTKDKKDLGKKYINSLWFSPKDFKLRRNSRIFNKKRLEMYCQTLHRGPTIPRCKCRETASKDSKRGLKASNYNILVRSGTPLGRRPNTPTRGAETITAGAPQRTRLRHCDIFDGLTLKDLAPFKAEYPRRDEITKPRNLKDSLLYKLAYADETGAEETLRKLIAPKLSCTEMDCKVCKPKAKSEKKHTKRQNTVKKSLKEITTTKNDDLQTLSTKAAAQLLMQNIGEIKSRKSSPKSQISDKCISKHKDIKKKRSVKSIGKNSKKALTQDSKSIIYQKIEENLVKNIFCNQRIPRSKCVQRFISSSPTSSAKPINSFGRVETFQTAIKIPEFHSKRAWGNPTVNKLFPYINDPENKVFQNITVLPVKILYGNIALNDTSTNKNEYLYGDSVPDNCSVCLSKKIQAEIGTADQKNYSTADDCTTTRIANNRRRQGTPKSIKQSSNQDSKKIASFPAKSIGVSSAVNETQHSVEPSHSSSGKEVNHQSTRMSSAKSKFRRSVSLGKSTESENGDFKHSDQQHSYRRSFNPNPWKPTSRIPESFPVAKSPMRIKPKEFKHNHTAPSATVSTGKILVEEETSAGHLPNINNLMHKTREKGINSPKRSLASHLSRESFQSQILVNKDKKMKFDMKPAKLFYEVDDKGTRSQSIRDSRNHSSSPSHKAMVDHLCALRNRNVKLQGSIQKAINIIEEKMVDVLSTKDKNSKKKTIERMEKEINNVLRMINEQSYKIKNTGNGSNDRCHDDSGSQQQSDDMKVQTELAEPVDNIPPFTHPVVPSTAVYSVILQNEERRPLDTKALVMHIPSVKKTKAPKKRATSRLLKLQARPSTVEEEVNKSTPSEENLQETEIIEKCAKVENGDVQEDGVPQSKQIKQKTEACARSLEMYPFKISGDQESLTSLLPCPTPIPSLTCQNLSSKAQKAIKKMSMKAFGKFADVVKTKTRLIINMTERIDLADPDMLPHPRIISTLPAQTRLPIITKMQEVMPNASNVVDTSVASFVSVHHEPATCIMNTSDDILDAPNIEIEDASTNKISEFGNILYDRSLTSFSESECFYTWPQLQRTPAIQSKDSTCTITHDIINENCLTPFMRALGNLRKSKLFENRHQLIPVEETSPSFTRLMDLLEGLSNINNRLNQKALKDVQLMWNPEKRCSFHSSMECSKRISCTIDTKAVSAHSIIQSLTSSSSETVLGEKPQDNPLKNSISTQNVEEKCVDLSETKDDTTEKFETEITKEIREIYKLPKQNVNEVECNVDGVKLKSVKLVLSEVHLISIQNNQSLKRELEVEKSKRDDEQLKIMDFTIIKDEYATFLKLFYVLFYGLMYFCMSAMNFTC